MSDKIITSGPKHDWGGGGGFSQNFLSFVKLCQQPTLSQISVCKRLFLSSLWLGVDSWAKNIIDGQLIPFFRLFQN